MVEKISSDLGEVVFTFFYTDGSMSNLYGYLTDYPVWKRVTKFSDANKTVSFIGISVYNYETYCYVSNFQLEEGSVATDYTPYKETSLDVSPVTSDLKSAGSVHDEWENGKVIKRVGCVNLGELEWYDGSDNIFYTNKPSDLGNGDTVLIGGGYSYGVKDMGIWFGSSLNLMNTKYTDTQSMKQSLSGVMLYYELVTPTEETVPEIDNYINVEGGGTLTFESDDTVHMPIPSTTRFVVDLTSTTEEIT